MSASDVLILGGGPAGSAAARLLATWGHRVRLVTARRPEEMTPALAESLPPSCARLFAVLGVERAIDAAGFVRSTGNTVWWGSDSRVESFGQGRRGWQVTTDRLARVLLESAREAGVHIEYRRASAEDAAHSEERFVLDCTGRAGVLARARGWRVYEPALKTVALVGRWRHPGVWNVPDSSHTVIESYADGWIWSVPIASGERYIAVMVDPRSSSLEGAGARAIYLGELRKAPRMAALTSGATCEGGPWGWDASMYHASCYADDRVLLVGDAASFIDPLSSAGVKKALASGWLAAVAVHTAVVHPGMRGPAFDFFAAREREAYAALRAMAVAHLADAAGAYERPFWSDREAIYQPQKDRDVEAAFERIRQAPELVVRQGAVTFENRPAVSGCEIVLERRLVQPSVPEGIRYLHDVDVVALVELAPGYRDVGDLFAAYTRLCGPVALPDFLLALATAVAREWLVWGIVSPC